MRSGGAAVRGDSGRCQLCLPDEPGKGLRGHGGVYAQHPLRAYPAPALCLAQFPPDRRYYTALHPGRGAYQELCQRAAYDRDTHGAGHCHLTYADVHDECPALSGGALLHTPGAGILHDILCAGGQEV